MPWITGCHHILGIKHLLGQLRHSESTVLLAATRRQRCKARHKEVKTGEGHQVDSNLPQVSIQLAYWLKGGDLNGQIWHACNGTVYPIFQKLLADNM